MAVYGKRDYSYVANAVNSDLQNSRNAMKLHDASKSIDELKNDITKLEMMIQAMFSIMKEQGVTTGQLNDKLKLLLDDKISKGFARSDSMPCPKCGKIIRESVQTPMMGRCMFCGTTAVFYPFMEEGQSDASAAPAEEENPVNDHMFDDLL